MTTQPMPLANRPGGGAYATPSSSALYARGLARATAQAQLKAEVQTPASVPPFWYLDDDGWAEARRQALEADLELSQEVWKTTLADKEAMFSRQSGGPKGDWWAWPARAQYEDVAKHEPLFEPRMMGTIRDAFYAQETEPLKQQAQAVQQAIQQGLADPNTPPPEIPPRRGFMADVKAPELMAMAGDLARQLVGDPEQWQQVPNEWVAAVMRVSKTETGKRLERYAELVKEYRK